MLIQFQDFTSVLQRFEKEHWGGDFLQWFKGPDPCAIFLTSCVLPWQCRRGPRLRCRRWHQRCCRCSAWLCCCFCASSRRSEGWRERTGPARRRGSRRERRGPKNPVCLYRCPKKNASFDSLSLRRRWTQIDRCHLVSSAVVCDLHRESSVNSVCVAIFHSSSQRTDQLGHLFSKSEDNINNLSSLYYFININIYLNFS